ncbi:MAG: transcriptional regulator NrdR [Caulobacteraceae bacterium]
MRCPFCGHDETQVKDSRPSEDGAAIRRRRLCPSCEGRFTTFERVQLRELTILKRSGRRTPFDRDKLARSLSIALRKRPVEPERVERMISAIVRQLESMGETELPSSTIGELIMKHLKQLDDVAYVRYASVYRDFKHTDDFAQFLSAEGLSDDVAYVRFASVYRNFREAKDFEAVLGELNQDEAEVPAKLRERGGSS